MDDSMREAYERTLRAIASAKTGYSEPILGTLYTYASALQKMAQDALDGKTVECTRCKRQEEALVELSMCDGSASNVANAEVLAARVRAVALRALKED
jgi:hypothetical protein